jgi:hypothetical protein
MINDAEPLKRDTAAAIKASKKLEEKLLAARWKALDKAAREARQADLAARTDLCSSDCSYCYHYPQPEERVCDFPSCDGHCPHCLDDCHGI